MGKRVFPRMNRKFKSKEKAKLYVMTVGICGSSDCIGPSGQDLACSDCMADSLYLRKQNPQRMLSLLKEFLRRSV